MEKLLQIPQLPLLELTGQSARPVIVLLVEVAVEEEEEVVVVVPEGQFGLLVAISPRALTKLLQEVELQAPQVETAAVVRTSELWMLVGAGVEVKTVPGEVLEPATSEQEQVAVPTRATAGPPLPAETYFLNTTATARCLQVRLIPRPLT
ncbi:hypothetical protein A3K56_03475 [Candidatus Beckwithbacteria bacterium RIFCSPHIGHO2_12_FULL_49_13]|nr:MAG: hypothetical protein A3K56_03475 [Candidatus Beckwithbacteria bacterium RIFCSPHIGHO2_12_FULL_49_13]